MEFIEKIKEVEEQFFKNKKFIELLDFSNDIYKKKSLTNLELAEEIEEIIMDIVDEPIQGLVIDDFLLDELKLQKEPDFFFTLEKFFKNTRFYVQDFYMMFPHLSEVDEETLELIEKNSAQSLLFKNETSFLSRKHPLYEYQPRVVEAKKYTDEILIKAIKTQKKYYGLSLQAQEYLVYVNLGAEEEILKELEEKSNKIVAKMYDNISLHNDNLSNFLTEYYVENVEELKDEELYAFFWGNFDHLLDTYFKKELLNELSKREFGNLAIKVEGNKDFNLYQTYLNAVDAFFKENPQFIKKNNNSGIKTEDIIVNLFKDPKKGHINLLDSNTLEGKSQPYFFFYSDYIGKFNDKIKDSLQKLVFSKDPIVKNLSNNCLNTDIIKEKIEEYYSESFDKYYENLINKMQKRVEKTLNINKEGVKR